MSTSTGSDAPKRPTSFSGINHLKLPCFDIHKTLAFYTSVLPMEHIPKYNHYTPSHDLFAMMFTHVPTKLIVEVRNDSVTAEKQRGWDPITWGVGTKADLDEWATWLDYHRVERSKIFTGIKGWVLACEDPDGKIVRLYCDEEHEWTDHPDQDEYWLGTVKGVGEK